ncbi:hypothetical protein NUK31_20295 [Aeromonas caviae]|uniref:Na+/H+ antiporter NhaC family protein n=1 Tax=Aeromonas caviae TaxID=648 RepID=UPI00214EB10D|nr:Na+/H+ antiporter NhaC family protein [Aeromonas caviae]MCR3895332.1 hypothetical protein [Aeromonas caviae]
MIGIVSGFLVLSDFSVGIALQRSVDGLVSVFKSDWATRILIFTMMVSGIIHLAKVTGGTRGLVELLTEKSKIVKGPISTQLLGGAITSLIFIDSYLSMLTSGAVTNELAKKYNVSREQLAYVSQNTGISIWSSVLINGWGAAMMGVIAGQVDKGYIKGEPFNILARAVGYNFFAWSSIFVVALTLIGFISFRGMREANQRAKNGIELRDGAIPLAQDIAQDAEQKHRSSASNLLIPLIATIMFVPVGLYITGDGVISNGSGSTSVLWAVFIGQFIGFIYYVAVKRIIKLDEYFRHLLDGYQSMIPLTVVLTLALLIGNVASQLEIGAYLSGHIGNFVPPSFIAAFIFIASAVISLATGTSWGTFSIMIPIGIQLAVASGADPYLAIGAAISGSIMGDTTSPISDTGIMMSTATKNDHMDHIKTQLPYCITAGTIALAGFILAGLFL